MCSIFGTNIKDLNLTRILGMAGMFRGIDATGIASISLDNERIHITKENKQADEFNWDNVKNGDFYLGHTRLTTKGTENNNYNNHPFRSNDGTFVLAHNGHISNDDILRYNHDIHESKIKTDSYIIVQLLQMLKFTHKKETLNIEIIKEAVELLRGTFAIAIVDIKKKSLFLVRSFNPINYLFDGNSIVYASTKEMLEYTDDFTDIRKKNNAPIAEIEDESIYEYDLIENKFINREKIGFYSNDNDKEYKEEDFDWEEIENNEAEDFEENVANCPECNHITKESNWIESTKSQFGYDYYVGFEELIGSNGVEEYFCPQCRTKVLLDRIDIILSKENEKVER